MLFDFATANRIIFGCGALQKAGPAAATMGERALVVIGKSVERADPLVDMLRSNRLGVELLSIPHEPTADLIMKGVKLAREWGSDFVIGMGGGSAIDSGKAIAALLNNPGDIYDYLEVIGRGEPLKNPPAPYIAIPTTSGTGSEVTKNAVISSPEHHVKVSLRSRTMLPQLAIVDPELTYSLPPKITASTGLDALTQVIEPYVSILTNPLTDGLCLEGIRRARRSIYKAYRDGSDQQAREDMALASLFGGLALANAKLGAVHGFAGPVGGMFPEAPHGSICGLLLPHVMRVNVIALKKRIPDGGALRRYTEIAKILTQDKNSTPEDGVRWMEDMCSALACPSLSTYGVTEGDLDKVIQKASQSSSMKGNPIRLNTNEMREILSSAL